MITSVYFSPQNQLDIFEQRLSFMRIPEVLRIVRRAQDIVDRRFDGTVDLANFICAEDEVFLHTASLRNLATALVQIGLYQRFVKQYSLPDFLVGNCKGEAAVEVVSGRMSLDQLITQCAVFRGEQRTERVASGGLPILAGVAMPEMVIYKKVLVEGGDGDVGYEKLDSHPQSLRDIFQLLHTKHGVDQWVNLGSDSVQLRRDEATVNPSKLPVQWTSSIDSDRMLEWFKRPAIPKLFAVPSH